jgi:hypothetical protein
MAKKVKKAKKAKSSVKRHPGVRPPPHKSRKVSKKKK